MSLSRVSKPRMVCWREVDALEMGSSAVDGQFLRVLDQSLPPEVPSDCVISSGESPERVVAASCSAILSNCSLITVSDSSWTF